MGVSQFARKYGTATHLKRYPGFIRKAVANVSVKSELSADGTEVRWLDGGEGTGLTFDGDESEDQTNWKSSRTSPSISKPCSFAELSSREELDDGPKINSTLPAQASESSAAPNFGAKRWPATIKNLASNASNELRCRPFISYATTRNENEALGLATDWVASADSLGIAAGTANKPRSKALRKRQTKLRGSKQANGPIVFYKRVRFCSDLSGDPNGATDQVAYNRYTDQAIGCPPGSDTSDDSDGYDKDGIKSQKPIFDGH